MIERDVKVSEGRVELWKNWIGSINLKNDEIEIEIKIPLAFWPNLWATKTLRGKDLKSLLLFFFFL